jgi:acyl dehydratase
MPALSGSPLPSTLASTVGLLWHRRSGLTLPIDMPHIERRLSGVRINAAWLHDYLNCTSAANWPATQLPPLALQIAAAPLHMAVMADRAFPFRPLGIVHQSQQIQQWHPLSALQVYDIQVFTSDARIEHRGISFGLVTEAWQLGTLVWRSEVRILSIQRMPEKTKQKVRPHELSDMTPLQDDTLTVPESIGRRYARIACDYNPVHVHAWLARPFGFRHAIAHGTWTLARALFCAEVEASPRYTLVAQFIRPVELPSRIRVASYPGTEQGERRLQVTEAGGTQTLLAASVKLAET